MRMSFYKGLAYLVFFESLRVMHSNDSEIWKALFRHRRSGAGLDHFGLSEMDRSASALLIGRVHAIRGKRWMFGKISTSHAPSASRRSLGSSFSADWHIVYHRRSSFPRDLGNGRSFSQNNMPSVASDSFRVLLTMIEGMSRLLTAENKYYCKIIKLNYFFYKKEPRTYPISWYKNLLFSSFPNVEHIPIILKHSLGPNPTRLLWMNVTCSCRLLYLILKRPSDKLYPTKKSRNVYYLFITWQAVE